MASYAPAFRLTVYVPRSVDPTETTVLSPVAGASHSDPFVVTSIPGVSGTQPYLDIPSGWTGSLDPIQSRTTTGTITVRLLDVRVAPGGSNAARWVTAFLGDAMGKSRLKGRKCYLEKSLDGGSTWAAYWTGRIYDLSLDSRVGVTCTIKDLADDQTRSIFLGQPHVDVGSYAFMGSLLPLGIPQDYGKFVPFAVYGTAASMRLTGKVYSLPGTATLNGVTYKKGLIEIDPPSDPRVAIQTQALYSLIQFNAGGQGARVVATVSGGGSGHFAWPDNGGDSGPVGITGHGGVTTVPFTSQSGGAMHLRFIRVGWIWTLPPTDPNYLAMPADGTEVSFYVTSLAGPSSDMPLFINDIHPIQLWADILDGKFSTLNADGSALAMAARDTSSGGPWDTLLSDPSLGTMRFLIEETWQASDFIEQCLCQPLNLGYRLDPQGRVVPIDLRRTASVTAAATLVDDDVVEGAVPQWSDSTDGAVTGVAIDYYLDIQGTVQAIDQDAALTPDVSPSLVSSLNLTVLVPNDLTTLGDVKENILKLDASGFRFQGDETLPANGANRQDALQSQLATMAQELMAPYTAGAVKTTIPFRTGTPADGIYAGMWCSVTIASLPDPATNQRGGTRLMLCTGRREQNLQVTLDFIDAGSGGIAVAPTLGAPAEDGTILNAANVTVTLNAAADPAQLHYAITATSVGTRPADNDAGWVPTPSITTGGSQHLGNLPGGKRIWVRARSFPVSVQTELPSSWIYPGSGTGYVDLTAPLSASAIAATGLVGNRVDLSWSLADLTLPVEVFLVAGSAPSTWTTAMQIDSLAAGSTLYRIGNLITSTAYTVGVRTRDGRGGAGTMATLGFTTTATPGTAPTPIALALCTSGG